MDFETYITELSEYSENQRDRLNLALLKELKWISVPQSECWEPIGEIGVETQASRQKRNRNSNIQPLRTPQRVKTEKILYKRHSL